MPLILRFYAGAARLAAPVIRVALRRRARAGKEVAARLPEREGKDPAPRPPGTLVWVHAASMGESLSIMPVLAALPPDTEILLTTGTVTSAEAVARRFAELGLRNARHRFVPLDVPGWTARFLDHWRPNVACFMESELWPNLLAGCTRRRIPLLLLNARMSGRSHRAWARVPRLASHLLGQFATVHAQSAEHAERFRALGARHQAPPGNLKLSAEPLPFDEAELVRLRGLLGGHPAWLAASTHPGEEEVAAVVHRRLLARFPGLVTLVAPRHADRGAEIAAALGATRRGAGEDPVPGRPWVADTMGELGLLYRLVPIVFVGRSMVGKGGQNPLEPARLGAAVAVGPFTANFREPVRLLREAGALREVPDAAALADWVAAALSDPEARTARAAAGRAAASGDPGLPAALAALILRTAGAEA